MYSINTYSGTGSDYPYPVTFPYLSKDHVEVRIDGVLQTDPLNWTSAATLSITAPAGTNNVDIRRNTPAGSPSVTFSDGSTLTDSDLNLEALQLLYIAQELADSMGDTNNRTLHYPTGEFNTSGVLPVASGRAGMLLGFDQLGGPAMLPVTASVGAGDMRVDTFVDGIDFTAGTSNQLTLSRAPGTPANVQVHFDAAYQGPDVLLSVVGQVLNFNSAIPAGVQKVYVTTGTTLSVQVPPDASVSTDKVIDGSMTDAKVSKSSKLWNRIGNIVDISDYVESGNTGDHAFTQAIAHLTALGGGEILVPAGVYLFAAGVDVPANIKVRGCGFGSVIRASTHVDYLFRAAGGDGQCFEHLQLDGAGLLTSNAIEVSGSAFVDVHRCLVTGAFNGIAAIDVGSIVSGPTIRNCIFINNRTAIYFQGGIVNGVISGIYQEGGDGIVLDKATNHCEGIMIQAVLLKPSTLNGAQGIGITVNAGLEIQIIGGVIDQVEKHGIVLSGVVDSVVKTKVLGTWVGHRVSPDAGGIGILVQGQVNDLTIDAVTTAVSPTFGIQFQAASGNTPDEVLMTGCMFLNNTTGDVYNNGTAGHYKIKNNKFQHATINYQRGSSNIADDLDGNTFKASPIGASSACRVGKNYGLTTRNNGTAVIPSGSTTVVVSHGLWAVPRPSQIDLRPVGIPTNAVGEISIIATDAATFTVKVRSDPGASGVSLDWSACVER